MPVHFDHRSPTRCVEYSYRGSTNNEELQNFLCTAMILCVILKDSKGRVTKEFFARCPRVSELKIFNSDINIDADAFEQLRKLRILVIENSVHVEWFLSESIFRKNTNLKSVYLRQNNITGISGSAFKSIKRLVIVNLSDNMISELESGTFIAHSKSLQHLDLSKNKLESISSNVFSFNGPSHASMNLSHNSIWKIDEDAFVNCNTLEELDLSNNMIQTLIQERILEGLVSLKKLDISSNQLTRVVTEPFERLPNLTYLQLGYNPITTIGREIPKFISRRDFVKLNLEGNRLKCLCNSLYNAYDEARRLNVSLSLTCDSGESWEILSRCSTNTSTTSVNESDQVKNLTVQDNAISSSRTWDPTLNTNTKDSNSTANIIDQVPMDSSKSVPQYSTFGSTFYPVWSTPFYNNTDPPFPVINGTTINNTSLTQHESTLSSYLVLGMTGVGVLVIICVIMFGVFILRKCSRRTRRFQRHDEGQPILGNDSTATVV